MVRGIHYQYYNHYDNIIGIDLNIVSLRVLNKKIPAGVPSAGEYS